MRKGSLASILLVLLVLLAVLLLGWMGVGTWKTRLGVMLLAAAIGFGELCRLFPKARTLALSSHWGLVLMLLNAVGAAGLFAFLGHLNPHLDPLVLMFLAGLGFPVVLRTNFTLIKGSVGDVQTEDIALKFSEVYDPLRDFCRDEINLAIMEKISESVTSLQQETNLSPVDLKQGLIKLARTTIAAHSLLSSDEKEAQRQEIDRLVDQFSKDPELQRLELCLLIIRNSSLEYLRKRLSHLRPPRPGITKEHVQQMLLPDKREQFLSNLSPERREHIQQYIQATMADDRLSEPLKEAYVAEMLLEAAGEQLDELL